MEQPLSMRPEGPFPGCSLENRPKDTIYATSGRPFDVLIGGGFTDAGEFSKFFESLFGVTGRRRTDKTRDIELQAATAGIPHLPGCSPCASGTSRTSSGSVISR